MSAIKIVFFGSTSLSVACLELLAYDERFSVIAVVSQSDKPAGRGHKLTPTPVSHYALENNIPLFRSDRPSKDSELFSRLGDLHPDYFIVVAYGAILPQRFLDIPSRLAINVHGSLLPAYRGASPVQTAIINQDTHTGVTIMQMSAGMDEGDMLSKEIIEISADETSGSLFTKFSRVSPPLLAKTIIAHYKGEVKGDPQDHSAATYTHKFDKDDARYSSEKTQDENLSRMRAFTPGAMLWGEINGNRYKFISLEKTNQKTGDWILPCLDGGLKVIEAIDILGQRIRP